MATPSAGTPRPGVRVGSTSEFSLFFRVRPGHEHDIRKAVQALQDSDRAEGIGAFNEGREPSFQDPDH